MARSVPVSTVLKWLIVIGGMALVLWLLLRDKRPKIETTDQRVLTATPVRDEGSPLALLDARLAAEGVVDKALYDDLKEALDYAAASSVPYANNRLKVLRARIRRGLPLQVHVPGLDGLKTLTTEAEFDDWEQRWLPGANSR